MTLTLHGVVRSTHPVTTPGFHLVRWDDLAMVVSGTPAPDPMTHLRTLATLVPAGPVVPLRFGTTAVDEDTVRTEVLAATAPKLRAHLDRLDGVAELHAYLHFDETAALRAIHDENLDLRPTTDLHARIRAGEQIANRLTTWRRARATTLLAPISALAREESPLQAAEPTDDRRAFLLPLDKIDPARTLITALSNKEVTAQAVGPLPAFTFLTEPASPTPEPASRWGW